MSAPALWSPRYRSYWAEHGYSLDLVHFQPIPRYPPQEPRNLQPPGPWSAPDRRRRSRIDWSALVDDTLLVNRQEGFERNATVLAMRDAGLSRKDIADRIGVTPSRVLQIINKAERQRGKPAPIEDYLQQHPIDDVAALRAAGTLSRLRDGDWRAP